MESQPVSDGGSAWKSALWGSLSVALAAALLAHAVDAHGRNAELHRRVRAAQYERARIRADEVRMRAELKALVEDPIYVESILQRGPAGAPGGPVVEK